MSMSGTTNATGFARDALAATALILDAVAVVGAERRTILTRAQNLVYEALRGAYGPEEIALGLALNQVIKDYEFAGFDR